MKLPFQKVTFLKGNLKGNREITDKKRLKVTKLPFSGMILPFLKNIENHLLITCLYRKKAIFQDTCVLNGNRGNLVTFGHFTDKKHGYLLGYLLNFGYLLWRLPYV
jgi:hypothetical protein